MKNFLFLLCITLIFSNCASYSEELYKTFSLTLSSSTNTVNVGEEFVLRENLKNISESNAYENFRYYERHIEEVAFYHDSSTGEMPLAKHMKGSLVTHSEPMKRRPKIEGFKRNLTETSHKPNKVLASEGRVKTHKVKILEPGIYRFQTSWKSLVSSDYEDELKKGEIVSNHLTVHVLPMLK